MEEEISQEKGKPRMHGCLKGCLIFFGVCVLAFVIGVAVLYHKREDVKTWAVEKTFATIEEGLMQDLPEGVDREEVKVTLDRLKTAIIEGKLSAEELERIAPEFERAVEDDELSADEIRHLLEVINKVIEEINLDNKPAE